MGQGYSIRPRAAGAAEIFIYEGVGQDWYGGVSAKQFAKDLRDMGNVNQIDLRINSDGGDVFDGLAIYRLLVDHKAKVTTYVDGIAASIASVIAMAGDTIRIAEAGEIMIHDAWTVAMGPADVLREVADRVEAVSGSIADVYAARTGQTREQCVSWMKAETTFRSADAVIKGFATEVVANLKMAAARHPSGVRWTRNGTPAVPGARTRSDLMRAKAEQVERMRARFTLTRTSRDGVSK